MTEQKPPTILGDALRAELKAIIKEVVREALDEDANRRFEERLLDINEAAKVLSMTTDWLYRSHRKLPFTRKLGNKSLRFSYKGMLKWIESRKY